MLNLRLTYAVWIVFFVLLSFFTQPVWAKSRINTNWRGLAVKGYDVVAYFTSGQPTKGQKAFRYHWQDAEWRFSSSENLAAFKAAPETYAPQYGGY